MSPLTYLALSVYRAADGAYRPQCVRRPALLGVPSEGIVKQGCTSPSVPPAGILQIILLGLLLGKRASRVRGMAPSIPSAPLTGKLLSDAKDWDKSL